MVARRAHGPRRNATESSRLLLDSARRLFAETGYTRTSTKRIAAEAGVAEVLLFRHFGSKAALFIQAVYEPVIAALHDFAAEWAERTDLGPGPAAEAFVKSLYSTLLEHRRLTVALAGVQAFNDDIDLNAVAADSSVSRVMSELERVLVRFAKEYGFSRLDPPISARVAFGTALGLVVFGEWLSVDDGGAAADPAVLREFQAFLQYGVLERPLVGDR